MCLLHMEVGTWVRCDQENAKGITEDSGEEEGSPETLHPTPTWGHQSRLVVQQVRRWGWKAAFQSCSLCHDGVAQTQAVLQ